MNTSPRARPASSRSVSRNFPARPTNGRPALSSLAPGASPTSITSASCAPSPGTMLAASSQMAKPQPRWVRISSCRASSASMHRPLPARQGRNHMLAATLLAASALAAAPFPETIPVPPGSLPEGIASGKGNTFYAGSRLDGSVYAGNYRTGRGAIAVPGGEGRKAFGLKLRRRQALRRRRRHGQGLRLRRAHGRAARHARVRRHVRQRRDRDPPRPRTSRTPTRRSRSSTATTAARARPARSRSPATSSTPPASTPTGSRRRRTAGR